MIPKLSLIYTLLVVGLWSCGDIESGESLAKKHCASCHQYPKPALLDRKTWRDKVFPEMAFRMGLDMSKLPEADAHELREILRAIPPAPLVSDDEWKAIHTYYLEHAPDSLQQPAYPPNQKLHQFSVEARTLPLDGNTALTMIRSDIKRKRIYVGTRSEKLYVLDYELTPEDSFMLKGPPSDMLFSDNNVPLVLSMGLMDPNDQVRGTLVHLALAGETPEIVIDSLKRPVDIERADFNQDGNDDYLISSFGNFTGDLAIFEKAGERFRKHVIHHFPGTRKTITRDFNEDGLPDILALITQGDERIALFTNRGKFRFSYQVLLRFPPSYGSSYFELADFNDDDHPDIVYANGDNADYSASLKPYHGVRVFLNDGRNDFSEWWFHPMHGASMTKTADFDMDGDFDIAAISFFPDFEKHAEHGFVYFENGGGEFTAFHTPLAADSRWITMETTDIDDDSDTDLMIAALTFPSAVPEDLFQRWGRKKVSLLVLKNNLR